MLAMFRLPQRRIFAAPLQSLSRTIHSAHASAAAQACRPAGLIPTRRGGTACVRVSPLRTNVRRKTTESAEQGEHAPCALSGSIPLASTPKHSPFSSLFLLRIPQSHRLRWQP